MQEKPPKEDFGLRDRAPPARQVCAQRGGQDLRQTKEPELRNAFDWLARIVCFAFPVSPQALVSQMNRATAEVQKTLAEKDGFAPILAWVKALVDSSRLI